MARTDDIAESVVRHLAAMTEEERLAFNTAQIEEAGREHAAFKAAFENGECYLCGNKLDLFKKSEPCLHWYLRPSGVRKNDYQAVFEKYGMMQTQTWFQWVANEGEWASKIADTSDEEYIVQLTANYKDYSWSISCSKSDFEGHGKNSNFPHYHLQMWINERPFISYNNFHIRIPNKEVIKIKAMQKLGGKSKFPYGESYDDIISYVEPEQIISMPVSRSRDDSHAMFNISTMILADEGSTISGEAIYDLYERAKSEGVTIASLVDTLPNVSAATIIEEGPAVIDPMPRTPTRRRNSKE